jgi:dipeptidyl-peptidase-4
VSRGALRVNDLDSGEDTELIGSGGIADISYGLAEFVAAEEMDRQRGFWWAPDGSSLLVARVDNTSVNRWHIGDPANPERQPTEIRYPAAGTPNAVVELLIVRAGGGMIPVRWDSAAFTYLTTVSWDSGAPLIVVQSRDQRRMQLLSVDQKNGATTVLREEEDPRWLDVVSGVPTRLADGRIAWTADADDARRLFVASEQDLMQGLAEPVTPPDLQVRSVLSVAGDTVLLSGSDAESTQIGVWAYGPEGLQRVSGGRGVQGAVRRHDCPDQPLASRLRRERDRPARASWRCARRPCFGDHRVPGRDPGPAEAADRPAPRRVA